MIKEVEWEYSQVVVPDAANVGYAFAPNHLNGLGERGWELVAIIERSNDRVWVFKRPVRADTATSTHC